MSTIDCVIFQLFIETLKRLLPETVEMVQSTVVTRCEVIKIMA